MFSMSAPVNTRTTPGIFSAALVSMLLMRACAYSLRKIAMWSMPGSVRSAVNLASPRSISGSSLRLRRAPKVLPVRGAAFSASAGLAAGALAPLLPAVLTGAVTGATAGAVSRIAGIGAGVCSAEEACAAAAAFASCDRIPDSQSMVVPD